MGHFRQQKIGDFKGLRYNWSQLKLSLKKKSKQEQTREHARMFGGSFEDYMARKTWDCRAWDLDNSSCSSCDHSKNVHPKKRKRKTSTEYQKQLKGSVVFAN